SETRLIELRVSNGKAYVWSVDDVALVRSKYRLCGVLSGTLPHLSQQNVFLGVPLVLLPEEAVLLVEIGAAVIVDDPFAHIQPTVAELQGWNANQEESIRTQLAVLESKAAKESATSGRALTEEAQRKRREREERKKAAAAAAASQKVELGGEKHLKDATSSLFEGPSETTPDPPVPYAATKIQESSVPYSITIPASSTELPWYAPQRVVYASLEQAKNAGIWDYPSNLTERARCGVFHGLWDQGFYMGGGIKFGGEYLVYPGDPLRYHSHFTASVIDSPVAKLRPMEIVAHGRLGTATKKSHLLCCWNDEKKEVSYMSIQWAGFG
ncbi:hypothetical protein FA15DRAFT_570607, partial [Coprinopsis marcescibilis]